MTKTLQHTYILFVFSFLAIIFISLAIYGGIQLYSPIPFYDMWDAYLNFYVQVNQGDIAYWWSQHNEHRIVLSRILFWIDIRFFQGRIWFLIVINYLLITITFGFFYIILNTSIL